MREGHLSAESAVYQISAWPLWRRGCSIHPCHNRQEEKEREGGGVRRGREREVYYKAGRYMYAYVILSLSIQNLLIIMCPGVEAIGRNCSPKVWEESVRSHQHRRHNISAHYIQRQNQWLSVYNVHAGSDIKYYNYTSVANLLISMSFCRVWAWSSIAIESMAKT